MKKKNGIQYSPTCSISLQEVSFLENPFEQLQLVTNCKTSNQGLSPICKPIRDVSRHFTPG